MCVDTWNFEITHISHTTDLAFKIKRTPFITFCDTFDDCFDVNCNAVHSFKRNGIKSTCMLMLEWIIVYLTNSAALMRQLSSWISQRANWINYKYTCWSAPMCIMDIDMYWMLFLIKVTLFIGFFSGGNTMWLKFPILKLNQLFFHVTKFMCSFCTKQSTEIYMTFISRILEHQNRF